MQETPVAGDTCNGCNLRETANPKKYVAHSPLIYKPVTLK